MARDVFKRQTKWLSKASASSTAAKWTKKQGRSATFQIKQKGSKWAVFARRK